MSRIIRTDLDILSSLLRLDGTFTDPSVTTTLYRQNGADSQIVKTFPTRIDNINGLKIVLLNANPSETTSAIIFGCTPTNKIHISITTQ